MSKTEYLNVWHEKELVGKLWKNDTDDIGFSYEKDWMSDGFAISQQLPLDIQVDPPSSGKAHKFFANLLPEAGARFHIVRDLKIPDSDFELLKAIGGECAGAFSIIPEDGVRTDENTYRKLDDNELETLLLEKGQLTAITYQGDRPRLSLAGAQDKCPIFYDGKDYFLPQDNAASTHILKFELADYRNVPLYESFLTKLAEAVALPVVDVQLRKHEKHAYLLIKRYDRILTDNKKVQRIHQEDFCQALGYDYGNKYQEHSGPSFVDCYNLIKDIASNPIRDTENLLRWQIFNVLAGNSDAHAKNIAIIYKNKHQIELAPFYDLVCTRAIGRIDAKLAMAVDNAYIPNNVTLKNWGHLAESCNVRQKYLKELVIDMAENLLDLFPQVQETFEESHGPYPTLQHVNRVVTKQCQKIIKEKN